MTSSIRRAVSMVEVLVVIGIIGVLTSLLLPAVQSAREASRRSLCLANLRQVGLAVHNYLDAQSAFPPGVIPANDSRLPRPINPNWSNVPDASLFVRMLPYVDASTHFDSFNFAVAAALVENRTACERMPAVYLCPSDSKSGIRDVPPTAFSFPTAEARMAFASYAGNFGSVWVNGNVGFHPPGFAREPLLAQETGVFNDISPIRPQHVLDGLSKTVALAERAASKIATLNDDQNLPPRSGDSLGWWRSASFFHTLFSGNVPPNVSPNIAPSYVGERVLGAASMHPGGVHIAYCDGSATFISDSIGSWGYDSANAYPAGASLSFLQWVNLPPPGVWQGLLTRAGGERGP